MKKILIIGASWVGDAVLSQPLLAYLKSQSHCHIDVLAPTWTRGVLERMAEVDGIIDSPLIHKKLNLKALWQCAQTLKTNQYDEAYLLPNSFKSALLPWLAKIPQRIGYAKEGRGLLLTNSLSLDKTRHPLMVQRFLALASDSVSFNERHYPQLLANAAQQKQLIDKWQLKDELPMLVLCPGAEFGPAKRWPESHYQQVAQHYLANNHQVLIMGSNKDRAIGETISQSLSGPILNLCGQTNLAQAVDLMALAQAVVTNDSGLMHVAAALGRPLVAIFGSSSPQFTPPLSAQARILSAHLSCSPCFERVCPLGHLNCLKQITPAQVIHELNDLVS